MPNCALISCPLGALCIDGVCQPVACDDESCPEGQVCIEGQCVQNGCDESDCMSGEQCVAGDCAPDPCLAVQCPPGQICTIVQGTGQCRLADNHQSPVLDSGPSTQDGSLGDGGVETSFDALPNPSEMRDFGLAPSLEFESDVSIGEPTIPPDADDATGCTCDLNRRLNSGQDVFFLLLCLGLGRRYCSRKKRT